MKTYIYIIIPLLILLIPLLIALAIFHPLVLADDDGGCSYENGCLANPPSGSDSIWYFTPPSYFSPSVYPTPGYATPGYASPYVSPYTSPYASPYVTPAISPGTSSGGQNTNLNQNQAQQQSATGGSSSATGGSSTSSATGGGGGEGGDAGVARVSSDTRSSSTSTGGTSTVNITNAPAQRITPTSEVRVVTQAQPRVAGVTATTITELPKTGLPLLAWAAASFLPMGFGLKRLGRGSSGIKETPNYTFETRRWKMGS